MYSSGCGPCPSQVMPGPLLYWSTPGALREDGNGMVSSLGAVHPYQLAYTEALKRTSFYIADLLHPTVVPLPGTLTAGPRPASPPEGHLHPASSRPTRPKPIRSQDLKFGIDRILTHSAENAEKTDGECRSPSDDMASSPSTSPVPAASPLPITSSSGSFMNCSCMSAGSPLSLASLRCIRHGRSQIQFLQHGSGPAPHPLQFRHPLHKTPMQSYPQHHISEFPAARPFAGGQDELRIHHGSPIYGPYAVLSAETSQGSQSDRHSASGQSTSKRKRSWSRAVFSHLQRKGLEKRFEVQKYVTKPDRKQLAAMLGLTDAQVKVWFQNRRMKWRHAEEAQRQKDAPSDETQANQEGNAEAEAEMDENSCDDELDPCKIDDDSDEEGENNLTANVQCNPDPSTAPEVVHVIPEVS